MKSMLSFLTTQLRKNRGKNWGKHDWWFGGLMSGTRYNAWFSEGKFKF